MKKCPYCAEEIQEEAIFCRYCHHDLPEKQPQIKLPENVVAPRPPEQGEPAGLQASLPAQPKPRKDQGRPILGIMSLFFPLTMVILPLIAVLIIFPVYALGGDAGEMLAGISHLLPALGLYASGPLSCCFGPLFTIGLIFGIIGAIQEKRKGPAIAGIVLNTLFILGIVIEKIYVSMTS